MPTLPTDADTVPKYNAAQHASYHNTLAGLNNQLGNFTQAGSAPGSPASGDLWLDTATTAPSGTSVTYSSYTPTLTGPSGEANYGTGATRLGRYAQNGKMVTGIASFKFGTGMGVGVGGDWRISLPVTGSYDATVAIAVGSVRILDSGTTYYLGIATIEPGSSGTWMQLYVNANGNGVSSTVPMTWAVNDQLTIEFTYEVP